MMKTGNIVLLGESRRMTERREISIDSTARIHVLLTCNARTTMLCEDWAKTHSRRYICDLRRQESYSKLKNWNDRSTHNFGEKQYLYSLLRC